MSRVTGHQESVERTRRNRGLAHVLLLIGGLLTCLLAAPGVGAAKEASCLRIGQVDAFPPRGEVYVDVEARCKSADFEGRDSIIAYVELHGSGTIAMGADLRIYADEPERSQTLTFEHVEIATGDPLLVRLTRFGRILDLRTIKVP